MVIGLGFFVEGMDVPVLESMCVLVSAGVLC